jgi:hypothetical protein
MIFADYCLPDMFQLYSSFLRVLITILLCRTRESKKSKGNHVMVFVCVYSKQKECKILSNIPLFYKALAFFFFFEGTCAQRLRILIELSFTSLIIALIVHKFGFISQLYLTSLTFCYSFHFYISAKPEYCELD